MKILKSKVAKFLLLTIIFTNISSTNACDEFGEAES